MHDGNNAFEDELASFGTGWKMAEVLQGDENLNDYIVVGFGCNEDTKRYSEYCIFDNDPNYFDGNIKTNGEAHVEFVTKELYNFIKQEYNLKLEFDKCHIMGSSMGGLSSLVIGLKNPTLFKYVHCVSNAFFYNLPELEKFIDELKVTNKEQCFYLDTGTEECSSGKDFRLDYINSNKLISKKLNELGLDVTLKIIEGAEHNERFWNKRLKDILLFKKN